MPNKNRLIEFLLTLKDKVSPRVPKVKAGFRKVGDEAEKTGRRVEASTTRMGVALGGIGTRLKGLARAAGSVKVALLGAFGVGAGAAAIKSVIDYADQLDKITEKLGISAEAMSQLKFVAEESNITFGQLENNLQRMTRRIADAAKGSGEAQTALSELGLSAKVLGELTPDQQLLALADAFEQVESAGNRAALAQKIFDTEGVAMVRIIKDGADRLREGMHRADAFGATISQKTAKQAAEFNQSMTHLKASASSLFISLTVDGLPALNKITKAMADAAGEGEKFGVVLAGADAFLAEVFGSSLDAAGRIDTLNAKLAQLQRNKIALQERIQGGGSFFDKLFGFDVDDAVDEFDKILEEQEKFERKREELAQHFIRTYGDQSKAAKKGGNALVSAEEQTTKKLKSELAIREQAYKDSVTALKNTIADQEKTAKQFSDFVSRIQSGPEGAGDPSFLDAAKARLDAETALAAGDAEAAIEKAEQAAKMLEEIQRSGDSNTLALSGLAKEIEAVANAAEASRKKTKLIDTERELQALNTLRESAAQKPIEVPIEVLSEQAKAKTLSAIQAAQSVADANPIRLRYDDAGAPEYSRETGTNVTEIEQWHSNLRTELESEDLKRGGS